MEPMQDIVPGVSPFELANSGFEFVEFAQNQPQYRTLPSLCDEEGRVVTRWKLSWRERLSILFGGSLWLVVLTFHQPLQPLTVSASCPVEFQPRQPEESQRTMEQNVAESERMAGKPDRKWI